MDTNDIKSDALKNAGEVAKETLKEFAALTLEIQNLTKAQNELDTSTTQGRERFRELADQIKDLKDMGGMYQEEIKKVITGQQEQEESIEKLKTQLSLYQAEYKKLSDAQKNGAEGEVFLKYIHDTSSALEEQKAALSASQQVMGNYTQAGESLKEELNDIVSKMSQIEDVGTTGQAGYQRLQKQADELKKTIHLVNKELQETPKSKSGLEQLKGGIGELDKTFSFYQETLKVMGYEEENITAIRNNLQTVTTALTALETFNNAVKEKGILLQINESIAKQLGTTQTLAAIKAEAAYNVVKGQGSLATKAVAAAQWLWNAALSANPIGIVIVAIAAAVAGIAALTKSLDNSSESFDKVKVYVMGLYEVISNYLLIPFKTLGKIFQGDFAGAFEEVKNGFNVIGNFEKGALEQIAKNRENTLRRGTEAARKNLADGLMISAEKLSKQLEVDKAAGVSVEKLYRKEMVILKNREVAYTMMLANITDKSSEAYKEMEQQLEQVQHQQAIREAEESRRLAEAGRDAAQKSQDKFLKLLELEATYEEARLKAEAKYQSEDFLTKKEYETRLFLLQQENQQRKLAAERKFNKISQEEYAKTLEIMLLERQEFDNKQATALNDYYREQQKELLGLIQKDTSDQIAMVEKEYEQAMKKLQEMDKAPVRPENQSEEEYFDSDAYKDYQQFLLNKAKYELELTRQKEEEVARLTKQLHQEQYEEEMAALRKKYEDELKAAGNSALEKNKLEIRMLEELIAEKKEKQERTAEYEEQVTKLQAEQLELRIKEAQELYDQELKAADDNAKAKYEAKKKWLEAELEIHMENEDKVAEIQKKQAENEKELYEARFKAAEDWKNTSMKFLTDLNSELDKIQNGKLEKEKEENEEKKERLKEDMEAGLIIQEEYNNRVAQMDAELDQKKKEIERQQAIRKRTLTIAELAMNTAATIMKNTAQLGFLPALPVNVMTGVLAAAQLAAVLSQPLPKARKGMMLKGRSHEMGGIPIEAEGGEIILTKGVSQNPALKQLASAINVAGGGVPFVRPNSDGGYATRMLSGRQGSITKKEMQAVMSQLKVYTTIQDFRRSDKEYTTYEDRIKN
ncbi:MAG: hypothetical protein LUG18_05565 [Candidatus Azobacteroides sp.]|nr:hypothetical protein [Candidatus Azobacteroides sp.]